MKRFSAIKIIIVFLSLLLPFSVSKAQRYKRSIRNPEKELFGKSLNHKTVKYKESPSIVRAKKKQAKMKKKIDKDYAAYVEKERKRAVKIQSPEVQDRMMKNRKESDRKAKEKRKKVEKAMRKGGKKYK
jgi:hypothetical protein